MMMISKQPCLQTLSKRNGDKATRTSKAQPARLTCHRIDKVCRSSKLTSSKHFQILPCKLHAKPRMRPVLVISCLQSVCTPDCARSVVAHDQVPLVVPFLIRVSCSLLSSPVSVVSGSCSTQLLHLQALPAGDPAAARSMPDAASALLAADYGSDAEEASIQGSAATAAEARDGSQSADGLPQGFLEVTMITPGERCYVLIMT